jgi:hypothetical protein
VVVVVDAEVVDSAAAAAVDIEEAEVAGSVALQR